MNVWYSFLAHCYAAQSAQCGSKMKHRAKHGERHIKTKHLRLLDILHPFIFFAANFSMNVWYSSSAHCDAAQSAQCGSKTKRRAKHGERHIKTRRLRLLKILHPFLSSSSFPIQTSEKLEATARVSQKVNP